LPDTKREDVISPTATLLTLLRAKENCFLFYPLSPQLFQFAEKEKFAAWSALQHTQKRNDYYIIAIDFLSLLRTSCRSVTAISKSIGTERDSHLVVALRGNQDRNAVSCSM
jgi:hypothetical protein